MIDRQLTTGRTLRRALAAAALAIAAFAAPAQAQYGTPQDTADLVRADLIAEPASIVPGQPFQVGIRLRMKEHWHTYWRNPGDSGSPTEVRWQLPEGFTVSELSWPAPQVLRVGPVTSFGYEGEAILLAQVTPPPNLAPGSNVSLRADIDYLVCEKECIPGEASLALPLAVGASSGGDTGTFDAARAKLPQPSLWPASFSASADTIGVTVRGAAFDAAALKSASFLPYNNDLIVNSTEQKRSSDGNGLTVAMARSQMATQIPDRVDGVLLVEEDIGGKTVTHAFELSAQSAAAAGGSSITLLQAALFALLAGVILNLMPCVFPVLSIKILHLTQHANESAGRVRMHGAAYTAGILVSFVILAGALFALRAGGDEIGWGFQLQSPAVVAALAFVLFAFGLSLSGLLPIGTSLTRVGNSGLLQRGGLQGSFFAGTLATVVATPCTAPFMGASIGFALTQPFQLGVTVFLALGLGLALPFLILAFVPALQRFLPRPGAWMETLKQFLAFPLYATVAWLIWVLSFQVGPSGLLAALVGLVLIAFGAFALTLAQDRSGTPSRAWRGVAAVSGLAVIALIVSVNMDRPATASAAQAAADSGGEAFTQAKLDTLLASEQPVFVNMTAAWCITCLVNERTTLAAPAVQTAFKDKNIVYLKGDWTNRNPEITRLLERFGRSGVPLYVLYRGKNEPVVLPQILTEQLVLDSLAQL
ncbi:MAG: protein-disulfide reductase DsbD family protein [Pseudolabrys sp.]|nr:protein-disulfide reductase DsbD family protein [Pseudolabrys sp.]